MRNNIIKLAYTFFIIAISFLFNTFSYASQEVFQTQIATGYSYNYKNSDSPFIISSDNGGKSWTSRLIPNTSSNRHITSIGSVTCDHSYCIALAYYGYPIQRPSLLISEDKGQTWIAETNLPFPSNPKINITLDKVKSSGGISLVSGNLNYRNTPIDFLLVQTNKANDWKRVAVDGYLPQDTKTFKLSDMRITNETIIIIGTYKNQIDKSFSLVSHDKGNTWLFFPMEESVGFPENLKSKANNLNSLSCMDSTCVAVGNLPTENKPLLVVSRDYGDSWTLVSAIKDFPVTDVNRLHLASISCSNKKCFIVGEYARYDGYQVPLIIVSDVTLKEWSVIQTLANPPKLVTPRLNSINCNNNTCVVLANDWESTGEDYLIITNDHGKTWTFAQQFIENLPDLKGMFLSDVNCTSTHCTVIGSYFNKTEKALYPLLLINNKKDYSWFASKDILNLPNGFDNVHLLNVTGAES